MVPVRTHRLRGEKVQRFKETWKETIVLNNLIFAIGERKSKEKFQQCRSQQDKNIKLY